MVLSDSSSWYWFIIPLSSLVFALSWHAFWVFCEGNPDVLDIFESLQCSGGGCHKVSMIFSRIPITVMEYALDKDSFSFLLNYLGLLWYLLILH